MIVVLFALLLLATAYQMIALRDARRHPIPAPTTPSPAAVQH
jgi:hypothetical protein